LNILTTNFGQLLGFRVNGGGPPAEAVGVNIYYS
jgi:hypothetical protein